MINRDNISIGSLVCGVYGLGSEDILYPEQALMYTGLIINKIKERNDNIKYELYCKDGKIRTFHSSEIIDVT